MRLNEIQEQVGQGRYRVDAHAVADAMLRRLLGEPAPEPADRGAQEECS